MTSSNDLDHPCRQTCSGWKQGYERGAESVQASADDAKDAEKFALSLYFKEIASSGEDKLAVKCFIEGRKGMVPYRSYSRLLDENDRLQRVIAKDLTEDDSLGAEYTYVVALKTENKKLRDALTELVSLKDLKESIEHAVMDRVWLKRTYEERKPKAWASAREALK